MLLLFVHLFVDQPYTNVFILSGKLLCPQSKILNDLTVNCYSIALYICICIPCESMGSLSSISNTSGSAVLLDAGCWEKRVILH